MDQLPGPLGDNPLTHYCIIRGDVPAGTAAAQLVHAAGESAHLYQNGRLPPGTYAVALAARSEVDLHAIRARLVAGGIPLVAITESDAPYTGQLMALGLAPLPKRSLKKLLSSLPLWKGGAAR